MNVCAETLKPMKGSAERYFFYLLCDPDDRELLNRLRIGDTNYQRARQELEDRRMKEHRSATIETAEYD